MELPLVLYSTNSWLSYAIAQRFYGGEHYVWCTPHFDPRQQSRLDAIVPPTSSPAELYSGLFEEARRGERHSAKIEANKAGILRGASLKRIGGAIGEAEEAAIAAVVGNAETWDFRPVLYVIPYTTVCDHLKEAAVTDRAHPLSEEYVIERLPRRCFDAIELPMRV